MPQKSADTLYSNYGFRKLKWRYKKDLRLMFERYQKLVIRNMELEAEVDSLRQSNVQLQMMMSVRQRYDA